MVEQHPAQAVSSLPPAPKYADFPRYVLPPFPRQVRLETSSMCNYACLSCSCHGAFQPILRTRNRMSMELFEAAVKDIATWSTPPKEIVPTNFGEWWMHPKWYEQAKLIERYLPTTMLNLSTVGALINDDILNKLATLQCVRWVNFSINAYFSETYERFHRRPGSLLARVEATVRRFRQMRPDVYVVASMVYQPEVQTELEKELFEAHWRPLVNQVEITPASYANNPNKGPATPVVLPCRSIFDGLVVFDSGSCSISCCFNGEDHPDLNVGHFPEEHLLDIWRGEKVKRLADMHNSGRRPEIGYCKTCTFA